MAVIPVTITGTMKGPDGISVPVEILGDLSLTGLSVGGGPIIPDGEPPTEPPTGEAPPMWIPIWVGPPVGWAVVPGFPAPTPSKTPGKTKQK